MAKPKLYRTHISVARRTRIFEGPVRESLIERTAELLNRATFSKFQFEAAARYGLRTALVLQGHGWDISDLEAAAVVSSALARIGAVRPTWEQGQPEYVQRETCLSCGGSIDVSDPQSRRANYCSETCRMTAKVRREEGDRYHGHAAVSRAFYLVAKRQNPPRHCEQCGDLFKPAVDEARFCSPRCARLTRGDILPDCICENCGKEFHPPSWSKARYCSPRCASTARSTLQPKECPVCQKTFKPHRAEQETCSVKCSRKLKAATLAPRQCAGPGCPNVFQPASPKARYCCDECRAAEAARVRKERAKTP